MPRRLQKDTFGYTDVGGGIEVRNQYLAGTDVPDGVRLEDESAAEEVDVSSAGPGYPDYVIAEGANQREDGSTDSDAVATEEVAVSGGVSVRRTKASDEAQQHAEERSQVVGNADDLKHYERKRAGKKGTEGRKLHRHTPGRASHPRDDEDEE